MQKPTRSELHTVLKRNNSLKILTSKLPTNDSGYFGWVVSVLDNAGIQLLEVFCLISGVNEGCLVGQVQLFQCNPGSLSIWASETNQNIL